MSDNTNLADLFPGFDSDTIPTRGANIFCRVAGDGPPVVLLHGYPQTGVMWHRIAPTLAETHRVVIPDLRGYGWSSAPRSDDEHAVYSKREMAKDVTDVMEALGHVRFAVVGHDRGARVTYRLALDEPGRVSRLAVLDIVPTHAMWTGLDMDMAMTIYHWMFLAQPEPLPETLIGKAPVDYIDHTIASWTKAGDLSGFDRRALDHYRAFFSVPERLHATCEDYRAGATYDFQADSEDFDAGNKITCPLLALWGQHGIPGKTDGPLGIWRQWATDVRGAPIDAGHFLPEENPKATLDALLPFLMEEQE